MRQVDKDGSGEIGFKEFLAILQPKGEVTGKSAVDKIVHLQDVKKVPCLRTDFRDLGPVSHAFSYSVAGTCAARRLTGGLMSLRWQQACCTPPVQYARRRASDTLHGRELVCSICPVPAILALGSESVEHLVQPRPTLPVPCFNNVVFF